MRRPLTHLSKIAVVLVLAVSAYAVASPGWLPARILGTSYPRIAQLARLGGEVKARALIRSDGSVSRVEILSGHPLLGRTVEANLMRWTFRSANKEIKGNESFTVTYEFRIEGVCREGACKEECWLEYPNRVICVSEAPRVIGGP